MRIPMTARVGIGAILAAIVLISAAWYWVNTRTYVALDDRFHSLAVISRPKISK